MLISKRGERTELSFAYLCPVPHTLPFWGSPQVLRFAEAEADAERALQLEAPVLNPKTLLRRATARQGLQKFRAARADYKQVRELPAACTLPNPDGNRGAGVLP